MDDEENEREDRMIGEEEYREKEEDYKWQKKNKSRESRMKEESKGVDAENCAQKQLK